MQTRGGALLVLVLVTRGDDYGAYDQLGGNSCGLGCSTAAPSLDSLKTSLLGLKSNDPKAITVIAVAGAPSAASGADLCGRAGCGCSGTDCIASPGTRLEAFTQLFSAGKSGVEDACAGVSTAGSAIQTAIQSRAAPACKAL